MPRDRVSQVPSHDKGCLRLLVTIGVVEAISGVGQRLRVNLENALSDWDVGKHDCGSYSAPPHEIGADTSVSEVRPHVTHHHGAADSRISTEMHGRCGDKATIQSECAKPVSRRFWEETLVYCVLVDQKTQPTVAFKALSAELDDRRQVAAIQPAPCQLRQGR